MNSKVEKFSKYGEGFVYFVRMGIDGPVKIGKSNDPRSRISSLTTGCPIEIIPLLLIPGDHLEKTLHAYFARCWIKGEWFKADDFLLGHVKALQKKKLGRMTIAGVSVPIVVPPDFSNVPMEGIKPPAKPRVDRAISKHWRDHVINAHHYDGPGKHRIKDVGIVY